MLCHTLGFQAYRWPHSTGQGESDDSSAVAGWFRHRVHVVNCLCSLFWAWTFDRGVITGSSLDIARIISRVNWRYNQHKIKWLVERLQLSNCCNSKICTRTWRIIHGGESPHYRLSSTAVENSACLKLVLKKQQPLRKAIFIHPLCCHLDKMYQVAVNENDRTTS